MIATMSGSPSTPARGKRMRCASDAQPDRQHVLDWSRIDALAGQLGPELTRPDDMLVCAQVQQEVQLLREQRVIVLEVVAKERECFNRGAAPDHHLRSAL